MLVQFGDNWIQKIPLTAKLDSACGLVQFWLSSEFFSSNYFQIGQHVVLLHIQIIGIKPLYLNLVVELGSRLEFPRNFCTVLSFKILITISRTLNFIFQIGVQGR